MTTSEHPTPAEPGHDAIAALAIDHAPAAEAAPPDVGEVARGPDVAMVLGLALYGDDLDLDAITRRMGCAPTRARSGRELAPAHLGADAAPSCPIGVWRLEVRGEPPTLADDLVESLLGRFPSEPSFWQPLHRDFALQLHLSIHTTQPSSGFILSTEALARCTVTGASLLVTCHVEPGDA